MAPSAAAQCKATHGCDHGFADAADGFPIAGDEVIFIDLVKSELRHGCNVGACCKSFFAASDHDAANGLVGVKGFEGLAEFDHQACVQGVELLRTVERDDAYFVSFGVNGDEFVAHAITPEQMKVNIKII